MQHRPRRTRKLLVTIILISVIIALVGAIVVSSRFLSHSASSATIEGSGIFAFQPAWTFESPERVISTPVIGNGRIYIRTDKTVRVLNALTGKELSNLPDIPGNYLDTRPPTFYQNNLFIPDRYGTLTAYNLDSSRTIWQACSPITGCRSPSIFDPSFYPVVTVAYSDNALAVARYDNALTVYDIPTGRVLWEEWIDHRLLLDIHIKDNILLAGGYSSIDANDIQSGQKIWSYPLSLIGRFVVGDNVMYIVTGSGPTTQIVAFDTIAQHIMWTTPITTRQATIDTYLELNGDTLIIASDTVTAVDLKTGTKVWETDPLNDLEQPVISNGIVLVRGGGHYLFAVNSTTGKQIGELDMQNYAPRSYGAELNPAIADNFLIVPVSLHNIVAFDLQKP